MEGTSYNFFLKHVGELVFVLKREKEQTLQHSPQNLKKGLQKKRIKNYDVIQKDQPWPKEYHISMIKINEYETKKCEKRVGGPLK